MKNRITTGIFFLFLMLLSSSVFAAFSENSRQGLPAISVTSQPGSTDETTDSHQGCGLRLRIFTADSLFGFNGGINLYRYADNNPVLFTDPFGLDPAAAAITYEFIIPSLGPLIVTLGPVASIAIGGAVVATGYFACRSLVDTKIKEHCKDLGDQIYLQCLIDEAKNIPLNSPGDRKCMQDAVDKHCNNKREDAVNDCLAGKEIWVKIAKVLFFIRD